jgi:hypothetical protein
MRREKTIRNENRETATNTKEIQGITMDYVENVYSKKMENVEEMDQFLDTNF